MTDANALRDGADKFEQYARNVKAQQIAETQGRAVARASERTVAQSPEEIWSQKFTSQLIAPVCDPKNPASCIPVAQAFVLPPDLHRNISTEFGGNTPSAPLPMRPVTAAPARKRGFFARLFGRR